MTRRSAAVVVVALVALIAFVAVAGSRDDHGTPLDPDNPRPGGTKALRLLLEDVGAVVTVTDADPSGADVVLILRDRLADATHERLLAFAADGGRVVVADPTSPLAAGPGSRSPGRGNECTIEAWADYDIDLVQPPSPPLHPAGGPYCLGTADGAVVTVRAEQAGAIVSLASPELLANEHLGEFDNARLAVAVLAPRPGTDVALFDPSHIETALPGDGDQSLWDLVPGGIKWALVQLGLAFAVFVVAVARRHGRPVTESTPVELAASDLVAATGTMYERSDQPGFAAAVLQHDVRRLLSERTGLSADADSTELAGAAARRFSVSAERIERALERPVAGNDELVALAHELSTIRQEVLDG